MNQLLAITIIALVSTLLWGCEQGPEQNSRRWISTNQTLSSRMTTNSNSSYSTRPSPRVYKQCGNVQLVAHKTPKRTSPKPIINNPHFSTQQKRYLRVQYEKKYRSKAKKQLHIQIERKKRDTLIAKQKEYLEGYKALIKQYKNEPQKLERLRKALKRKTLLNQ